MAFMVKCKQCSENHISNLYRMAGHIFKKHFSNKSMLSPLWTGINRQSIRL